MLHMQGCIQGVPHLWALPSASVISSDTVLVLNSLGCMTRYELSVRIAPCNVQTRTGGPVGSAVVQPAL